MRSRQKIFRIAAFLLLLSAGGDLVVADLFVAFQNPSAATNQACDESFKDHCFCCCGHIVSAPRLTVSPNQPISVALAYADHFGPTSEPDPIYRPPRA